MCPRQPHDTECGLDLYGNPQINPYISDRLRNEAAVLRSLREWLHSVPVPKLLGQNGIVYIKTALIQDAVERQYVDSLLLPNAIDKVTAQLGSTILPKLRSLHRSVLGSLDSKLPVIPLGAYGSSKRHEYGPYDQGNSSVFILSYRPGPSEYSCQTQLRPRLSALSTGKRPAISSGIASPLTGIVNTVDTP